MAIENVQHVYAHKRLYRRALRPVINQFFVRLEKNNK